MAKKEPFIVDEDDPEKLKKIIQKIWANKREELSEKYSQKLRDLVDFCLVLD